MSAWSAHGKLGSTISGSETAETPILCESCLGPNPYIRMTKDSQGKVCKVCTRPFTVFRWNPGAGSRFKKTEICTTCAKVKNVCQTCILDLQYGLPVQVRDAALGIQSGGPTSDKNREYFAETMDKQLEGPTSLVGSSGAAVRAGQELLRKAARKEVDYKKDRPQFCAAFARGNCPRGDRCPFKHELPSEDQLPPLSAAPVNGASSTSSSSAASTSRSIIKPSSSAASGLPPPQDPAVVSLFISSLPDTTTETSLREFFTSLTTPPLAPDSIKSVTLVSASNCAFVNFRTRQLAEVAAKQCSPKMILHDKQVRLAWGRSRPQKKNPIPHPAPASTKDA